MSIVRDKKSLRTLKLAIFFVLLIDPIYSFTYKIKKETLKTDIIHFFQHATEIAMFYTMLVYIASKLRQRSEGLNKFFKSSVPLSHSFNLVVTLIYWPVFFCYKMIGYKYGPGLNYDSNFHILVDIIKHGGPLLMTILLFDESIRIKNLNVKIFLVFLVGNLYCSWLYFSFLEIKKLPYGYKEFSLRLVGTFNFFCFLACVVLVFFARRQFKAKILNKQVISDND